ncbi:MAG: hypothetical protein PHE06_12120 [Lachnospiraceae bacterium]|nr:hypothetical protein [Lachnospiraceae bacterium]
MNTSVYLSNRNVMVVTGSGGPRSARIRKAWRLELPEGLIINGIITNDTELTQQLQQFWKENQIPVKKVILVLESSRLISKRIEMPKLKDKKIYEILPNEFTDIEDQQGTVYDYMSLTQQRNKAEIRAVATPRSYVNEFIQLFSKIGVSLSCITLGRSCLFHVLASMKRFRKKNVVFQILDGSSMTSILYSDGSVEYSTQRRIFGGTEIGQVASEIVRSVSSLQQFQITQGKNDPITEVYLAGVQDGVVEACQESIHSLGDGIQVSALCLEKNVKFPGGAEEGAGYLFPIGGLMPGKKEINLAAVTKRKVKKKKESAGIMKLLSLPLILLIGCSAITGALYVQNHVKQMDLDDLNAYLTNESNLEQVARANYLEGENASLQRRISSVENMNGIIASYPLMNSQVVSALQSGASGYAQVSVVSYNAESGLLTVKATADEVTKINQFIDRLQGTDLFERLDYKGYTYDEKELTYTINVSCYLAEMAGK